jgi:transposase
VIAAAVIGDVRTVSRFPSRDHFAAYNGTTPIEVSSGGRKVYRLSRRGNRQLNHATHMAAVTQIRHRHSEGRAWSRGASGASGADGLQEAWSFVLAGLARAWPASGCWMSSRMARGCWQASRPAPARRE